VTWCAWSPDGTHIALASADRTVYVWDVSTGREVVKLKGHGGAVRSCAWSPDGTRLASASDDKTVRVWDGCTREAAKLEGHVEGVTSCAWQGLTLVDLSAQPQPFWSVSRFVSSL